MKLLLHHGPGNRRVGQFGIQSRPVTAVVERVVDSIAGAGKQQAFAVRVFSDAAHVAQWMLGQAIHNACPSLAEVSGLIDEGIAIIDEVKINSEVRRSWIDA